MEQQRFLRENLNGLTSKILVANGQQYKLGAPLGDGAIGIVRKATDLKTQQMVAIKFLAPEPKYIELSSLDDIYMRFRREGQRGVALSHDHLVKIMAYEENENGSNFPNHDGPPNPFIIMEYIHGTTLEHYLRKRIHQGLNMRFNVTVQTIYIAYCITDALYYLHKKNLVHRDVKPANIYLTRAREDEIPHAVKLGDFGIVKWGDFKASITTGSLTTSGQPNLGTLKYMPHEQALNPKEVGVRADMYSLGITLFELFTSQILQTVFHVMQLTQQRAQRTNITSKLHTLGLGILPNEYEDLFSHIYNMLAPTPSNRPSSQEMEGRFCYLLDSFGRSDLYPPRRIL